MPRLLPLALSLACHGATPPSPRDTEVVDTELSADSATGTDSPVVASLRLSPRLIGPNTPIQCLNHEGIPQRALWQRAGESVGYLETLDGPHPVGARVHCEVDGDEALGWVSTGRFGGNLLLVILDDVGIDKLAQFDHGRRPPQLATVDQLASEGVLFRYAYTSPICSPTRASVLTGLHPSRHGVGRGLSLTDVGLSTDSWTLAEALADTSGHTSAAIGKWHLGAQDDNLDSPRRHGFAHFAGSATNLGRGQSGGYYDWARIEDGVRRQTTTYATTDSVDSTLRFLERTEGPWMVWLALHASHTPFHDPPPELLPFPEPVYNSRADQYDAALVAADTELGRLLEGLGEARDSTTIVVLGDNGTPDNAVRPPLSSDYAKATPYEGGIHVPLIISGPMVADPGRSSDELTVSVDLFPTLLDLAGVDLPEALRQELDGRSLLPLLSSAEAGPVHEQVFVENFQPVHAPPEQRSIWNRVLRDGRWKYIRRADGSEEFFELGADLVEESQLLREPLTAEAREAFERLRTVMDTMPRRDLLTESKARSMLSP